MQPNDPRAVNSGDTRPSNQTPGTEMDAQATRNWMDHERVAALHDGKLGDRERDELLADIAADEDESWLFAETAAVLADMEAAHGGATVIPIESRRRSPARRWMAYGAIAAGVA